MKVFISHSSNDKWAARQICKELDQRGIDSFLDEKDIESGDLIDDVVDGHLADCDELLIILSPASLSSPWVLIEIGGARALKKRLVPILLHVGTNELPHPISRGLARDINEIDVYFDEVVARSRKPRSRPSRRATIPSLSSASSPPKTFSVGDRVRLPPRVPTATLSRSGRDVGWNAAMDDFLGAVTTVTQIDPEGVDVVHVNADGSQWYWLMDWLTPVEGNDADIS